MKRYESTRTLYSQNPIVFRGWPIMVAGLDNEILSFPSVASFKIFKMVLILVARLDNGILRFFIVWPNLTTEFGGSHRSHPLPIFQNGIGCGSHTWQRNPEVLIKRVLPIFQDDIDRGSRLDNAILRFLFFQFFKMVLASWGSHPSIFSTWYW